MPDDDGLREEPPPLLRWDLRRLTMRAVVAATVLLSLPIAGWPDEPETATLVIRTAENDARTVEGRILVTAQDGGLLVEDRALRLWTIAPGDLVSRQPLVEAPPLDAAAMAEHLRAECGDRFEIVTTKHYVIATSADRRYGEWCGTLLERLLHGFLSHWERSGLPLHAPRSSLPVIVFATPQEYADYATRDAAPQLAEGKGYYSVRTNRIALIDLTEGAGGPARTAADIARNVARSPFNAATVVHEATHQIAFNCGLHRRYADNPMWLTEGMAMYFETPDLRSRSGWRTIGQLNPPRLRQFRADLPIREPNSLIRLISGEDRFRDPETALSAYAESWALTWFLIRTRREQYITYLRRLMEKPPLHWDTADERLADFQAAFGDDLATLDREFLRSLERQRLP